MTIVHKAKKSFYLIIAGLLRSLSHLGLDRCLTKYLSFVHIGDDSYNSKRPK